MKTSNRRFALVALECSLAVFLCLPRTCFAEVAPIAGGRANEAVYAYTPAGQIWLPAREVLLEGKFATGVNANGRLILFFDPATSHFIWRCQMFRSNGSPQQFSLTARIKGKGIALYSDRDLITAVEWNPDEVRLRDSTDSAANMNDAETRALADINQKLSILEHDYFYGWKQIPLPQHLRADFTSPKDSAALGLARIVDVAKKDANWEIVLEGQWREKVVINAKWELVKTMRVQ